MRILKLAVVKGPDAPISITFQGQSLSIGRGKDSDLVLGDTQASRKHCEIIREGQDFVVVDLGGANGTFLGDAKAPITRHTLANGDSIHIGRNVLEVTVAMPPDEDATEVRPLADPDVTVTTLRPIGPSLVVRIVSGPDQGKVFTPDKDRVEIGRRPNCDIRLSDHGVSRLHATIRRENGRFMLYDEDSANGIETPGTNQRVSVAELRDGMVLRFSETEIQFDLGGIGGRAAAKRSATNQS